MELPVKFKMKSLNGEFFVGTPILGNCENKHIDQYHAGLMIKLQERLGNNMNLFLRKIPNHSGLLKDRDFMELLSSMISGNHQQRPSIELIAKSKFIKKWNGFVE